MNDKMFGNKIIFSENYFKIGEAIKVKIKNKGSYYDALVLNIDDDVLKVVNIEWNSPTCGCSGYEITKHNIWVGDIQEGKVEIVKYNESEDK